MPERLLARRRIERQDLLDAAVAVRRHDQHRPGQLPVRFDAKQEVVVELAPLPVIEELVAAETFLQLRQQRSQSQIAGQRLHAHATHSVR